MSFNSSQDVTIISLIVSVAALIVAIIIGIRSSHSRLVTNVQDERYLDTTALVQEFGERQKRLEQRLIDEKVRLEILELRLSKKELGKTTVSSVSLGETSQSVLKNHEVSYSPRVPGEIASQNSFVNNSTGYDLFPILKRDRTTMEILRVVMEGQGHYSAREIQTKIGRSREHIARMMNLLYKQGLVSRNVSNRPFTYSLTDEGKKELGQT
jgi:predicted transcriptional regulator